MKLSNLIKLLCITLIFFTYSCEDDIDYTTLNLKINLPKDLEIKEIKEINIELININTDKKSNYKLTDTTFKIDLEEGLYNIFVTGTIKALAQIFDNGEYIYINNEFKIRGLLNQISIKGSNVDNAINTFFTTKQNGLVISEIYFTGLRQYYQRDKFIELYNNSDEIIYADGYAIAENLLSSTTDSNQEPDITATHFTAKTIYKIPGNGKQYPLNPGETLLISDQAINHSESFNLEKSNFEWFDDNDKDIDNVNVENLIKICTYSSTYWTPNNSGHDSFVLFKLQESKEEFINKYQYEVTLSRKLANGKIYKYNKTGYKIDNLIIEDAVGLCPPSKYVWNGLHPTLDLSYTHSGDSNDERYGKSVSRKVAFTTKEGRKILLDSNNSSVDFEATTTPTPGFIK